MGLVIDLGEALKVQVGVDLGRRYRRVAEQLLDRTEVGPTLEQMSGRAVPQTVRTHVRGAVDGADGLVHDGAGLPRVEATAARAEQ